MLGKIESLKAILQLGITCKYQQGHDVTGLQSELAGLTDSYDALQKFAEKLEQLPYRSDWKYEEPEEWEDILSSCEGGRPPGQIADISTTEACAKAREAFMAAVAGCMLGKPLEIDPTLDEIRQAAESIGQWPLDDYITMELLETIGRQHPDSPTTTRGNISFVTPDDDINYTVLGMIVLEDCGLDFTRQQLSNLWLKNLPLGFTWGPERTILVKAGMDSLAAGALVAGGAEPYTHHANIWNPKDEACGAAIRADAYGYACPSNPALAARLAWQDSGMTHRKTGVYATMYTAAAIAAAFTAKNPLEIFETAQKYVPQKSRFYEVVSRSLNMVSDASDWLSGYRAINNEYGQYRHCQIYQETALLINTAAFSESVEDAICKQVASGCDTDCYGEIIGSIMGAYFGSGDKALPARWLEPFNDTLYTALADFHEQSLSAVADRMAQLPKLSLESK